jgi:spore coat polysaccharide biosynthesis protein SpsF (cytidylyltransferase family)
MDEGDFETPAVLQAMVEGHGFSIIRGAEANVTAREVSLSIME